MQYGIIRNRQGGTTGDNSWQTAGTSNTDTSSKAIFTQCGSIDASAAGDVTVTFPTAYGQAPLVIATVASAASFNTFVIIVTQSTTGFTFRCLDNGNTRRAEKINWMAVGQ